MSFWFYPNGEFSLEPLEVTKKEIGTQLYCVYLGGEATLICGDTQGHRLSKFGHSLSGMDYAMLFDWVFRGAAEWVVERRGSDPISVLVDDQFHGMIDTGDGAILPGALIDPFRDYGHNRRFVGADAAHSDLSHIYKLSRQGYAVYGLDLTELNPKTVRRLFGETPERQKAVIAAINLLFPTWKESGDVAELLLQCSSSANKPF